VPKTEIRDENQDTGEGEWRVKGIHVDGKETARRQQLGGGQSSKREATKATNRTSAFHKLHVLSCLRPSSPALPGDLTEIFRSSEYEQDVTYGCLHEDMEQHKL